MEHALDKSASADLQLLDGAEAASLLGVKPQTLATWRTGRGPAIPFVKLGRRSVRYRLKDVLAFIASRTVTNTAQGYAL